ncbi:MAG: hypothetical protein QM679_08715 [Patulibacter sp.]
MVAFTEDVLKRLENEDFGPSTLNGQSPLPIQHVRLFPGEEHDGIQDVRVVVVLDVSEDDGWEPAAGAELRHAVRQRVSEKLAEENPHALFFVTAQLQARENSAADAT